jgi:hypothetical protein
MNQQPLFPIMETWSTSQKLAVYDFCKILSELLWQQYEEVLIEEMIRLDHERGLDEYGLYDESQGELPFDYDDLNF